MAIQEPDGHETLLAYDGVGSIVRARNAQQEVTFSYTAAGALAERQQAGQRVQLHYDRQARLTGLTNERGEQYKFTLDAAGRVIEEEGFDGLTRHYERDAAGQVTRVHRPAARSTTYTYDAAGRVSTVHYNDGTQERYSYDATGSLIEAHANATSLLLRRDALGRVVQETQGNETVERQYNALGQRTGLHSSRGAAVALRYDAQGEVTAMATDDQWRVEFDRDANGLELYRRLSGVQAGWQRDGAGRLTGQYVVGNGDRHRRRYQWQGTDQLTAIEDSLTGETRFTYDARGALTEAHYADGSEDLRRPDAVGDLFRSPVGEDRLYDKGGQLQEANGTRYRYDAEGNLIQKTTPAGATWRYDWDGAGQLARVLRPDGYAVEFTYDALGRRLSKRYRGRLTRWVWDGNKPLHEWQEVAVGPRAGGVEDLVTWLFEEHSFAPAAKLTAQGAQSVVCDHLGTPLELYDQWGRKTWQAQLDAYGAVRQGKGKPQDCPFRYPGQYEDVETGLYYNRFRYYDPEAGQYISQDPIRLNGGTALYAYVRNPLAWLDPFGLEGDPEIHYRTMSKKHFDILNKTGKVKATGETSTSRVRAYAEEYDGVTVEFKMKPGTTQALENIGVSDGTADTIKEHPSLPKDPAPPGWGKRSARFKSEGNQVTIQLGKGPALDVFNENIISHQEVSRRNTCP